jgi:hypothetical protein
MGILQTPINVGLPNGTILQSNQETCLLNINELPRAAREAHTIPGLTHSSLISIGTLCDAGCTAEFDQTKVVVKYQNKNILEGPRDTRTGLWRIPMNLTPTEQTVNTTQQCNNAYKTQSIPDLIKFLHATTFSPTKNTWLKAIKQGFFQSWPGLTYAAVSKHFPTSMDMHNGHMESNSKKCTINQKINEQNRKRNNASTKCKQ